MARHADAGAQVAVGALVAPRLALGVLLALLLARGVRGGAGDVLVVPAANAVGRRINAILAQFTDPSVGALAYAISALASVPAIHALARILLAELSAEVLLAKAFATITISAILAIDG